MIAWGDALIKELAARRCIVFLGAGASAGCESANGNTNPPKWDKLLETLNEKLRNNPDNQKIADSLIKENKLLDAAEVIHSSINHADYVDAMRQIFETPKYKPSSIHESVLKIDPKITITTNFDTIYDLYCRQGNAAEGYNVFKYTDKHLVGQLRSPIRCIIKAHGCITAPESMVLTRSQFFTAKQDNPHFFRILDAIFLTHTILFLGYSMNDPDIQLALENANISAPSSHRHYFITSQGTHSAIRQATEKTYNLEFLEFPEGDYQTLTKSVSELAERVLQYRTENPDI